jgi:hypothetical protein
MREDDEDAAFVAFSFSLELLLAALNMVGVGVDSSNGHRMYV